jgi:hypothetical protein
MSEELNYDRPVTTPPDPVQPIPADIVAAILSVKVRITKIAHDAENKHGGYTYASGDAIYDALRKLMAEHGLIVLAMETGCEKAGDGKTIKATFQFILATEKSTWTHSHNTRTQYQPWMGAQTFQAAQSYAEKAFLKSLFKLSTGEPDTETVMQATQEAPKKKTPTKKMPEGTSKAAMETLTASLGKIKTQQELAEWVEDNSGTLMTLQDDHSSEVRRAYAERQGEIKSK